MNQAADQDSGDFVFGEGVLESRRPASPRGQDGFNPLPEEALARLTGCAADLFDAQVAFVAFLGADRPWLESHAGLDRKEIDRAAAFCTRTLEKDGLLVIEDAVEDERTEDVPDAEEDGLRFYAGGPVRTPEGETIGVFSIMDPAPREVSEEDGRRLKDLAQMVTDQMRCRQKVREHEQVARRFEAMLKDPNMLVGVLSPEGTLLEANETALQYIEESREEVLGERFWETPWWSEEREEEVRRWIQEAAAGAYVEYEAELTGPTKSLYSVEGAVRPVTDSEGTVTALVISARDVTVRKEREEELRVFKEVVEQANDAIIVTEADPLDEPGPRIVYANSAFEEMTGYTEEEIRGETPRVLQGPETNADVLASLREALEEKRPWEGETVNYRKDGTPYLVRWSLAPVRGEKGTVEYWASVQQDVTGQKRREKTLEILARALEQVGDKVVITDRRGRIRYVNEVFERVTGYSEEEVLGETPRILQSGEHDDAFYEDLWETILSGETFRGEFTNEQKDGTRYVEEEQISPITDEEGRVTHFVSAGRDVTERKERERQLRRSRARLEALFERSPDMINLHDAAGNLLEPNAQLLKKTGYAEEELTGMKVWELDAGIDPEDARQLWRGMEAGDSRRLEGTYRRKDGSTFPVEVHVRRLDLEGEDRFVAISRDVTDRKEAEEELKETTRFYEQVLEHVPIDLAVFSPDAEFEYANPQSVSDPDRREWLLGRTNEEYFRERGFDPAVGRQRDAAIRTAAQAKTRTELEEILDTTDDGPRHYLRVHGPVTNLEGEVTHVAGFGLDITERKRHEQALQDRRNKVEALYEATRGLLGVERPENVSRRIHEVVEEVFDYAHSNTGFVEEGVVEPVDVSTDDSVEVPGLDPQPIEGNSVAVRALRAGETVVVEDVRALDNNIDYGTLQSVAAIPIGRQGVIVLGQAEKRQFESFDLRLIEVLAGYGAAVLGRLEHERTLREERDLLDRLLATSPAAVVMLDRDGAFVRANERAEAVLGIGKDEVLERAFNDPEWAIAALDGSPLPEEELPFARVLATGEPVYDVEHAIEWPDGSRRILSVSGAPLHDAEGELEGAVFHLSDVTAQKQREAELVEAKEEAEEASRLKTAMLANMSHEVRTPLTTITGFAEILEEELEGQLVEFARRILEGGRRLMDTLNSVLRLSELEAGVGELERAEVDLTERIREILELLRPAAEENSIALESDVSAETVQGEWNENALDRILRNLVENAIKFTPKGGTVQVRAREDDADAVVEVEDTGVGISEEALPEIFEAFKQESEGLDREYEGSGLGLSIVKRLTEALGGTVEVESEKGEGSRFTVRLPKRGRSDDVSDHSSVHAE